MSDTVLGIVPEIQLLDLTIAEAYAKDAIDAGGLDALGRHGGLPLRIDENDPPMKGDRPGIVDDSRTDGCLQ